MAENRAAVLITESRIDQKCALKAMSLKTRATQRMVTEETTSTTLQSRAGQRRLPAQTTRQCHTAIHAAPMKTTKLARCRSQTQGSSLEVTVRSLESRTEKSPNQPASARRVRATATLINRCAEAWRPSSAK